MTILYNKITKTSSRNYASAGLIHKIDHAESVDNSPTHNLSTGEKGLIKATIYYFRAMLLGLIIISLFDHYLWDIWQGQVLFWLVCGILVGIASLNCSTWNNSKYANTKKCSTWNNLKQFSIFLIPLALVVWSFISIAWSENQLIGFYRSARFLELYGLFVYVPFRFMPYLINCSTWNNSMVENSEIVPRGTINIFGAFFLIVIFLGVAQSLIGIAQFIVQHSLGLFWLKESLIGQDILGVAKIIVNHQVLIRSYGLFPHPNILGGFLFFTIVVTLLYQKLFHPEESTIVPRGTIVDHGADAEQIKEHDNVKCSTWNNFKQAWKNVPPAYRTGRRGTIWLNSIKLVLVVQVIGLFLSFSKSAIFALVVALVYIIVPRGTNFREKIKKLFHVEQFRNLVVLVGVAFLVLYFTGVQFYALFFKSLAERMLYLGISIQMISANPLIGVGTGQFTLVSARLFPNLEIWQYQPVHNVFLLIWSEWGIVGLVLFIVFLWKLFHVEQS